MIDVAPVFAAVTGSVWAWTAGSIAVISLLSLTGSATLLLTGATFRRIVFVLVAFAAGALLGDVFLHLLPELSEETGFDAEFGLYVLAGIGVFFVIEKILHWHHAHLPGEEVLHPVAVTNIVGDSVHNFIDGALIAGAFAADTSLGLGTAVAVALHEIPQEIGDLGILVHAGMKRGRALLVNLLTALWAFAGGLVALAATERFERAEHVLVALTAGGFVYIAGSDLIPELQRETKLSTAATQFAGIGAGVTLMALLTLVE